MYESSQKHTVLKHLKLNINTAMFEDIPSTCSSDVTFTRLKPTRALCDLPPLKLESAHPQVQVDVRAKVDEMTSRCS